MHNAAYEQDEASQQVCHGSCVQFCFLRCGHDSFQVRELDRYSGQVKFWFMSPIELQLGRGLSTLVPVMESRFDSRSGVVLGRQPINAAPSFNARQVCGLGACDRRGDPATKRRELLG